MSEEEILRMVAFKLRDAARRIASLADECRSARLGVRVRKVAAVLMEQERSLRRAPGARYGGRY